MVAFEDPADVLDPRYPVRLKPWWTFKAGMVGYWLICASIGAMLAEIVR